MRGKRPVKTKRDGQDAGHSTAPAPERALLIGVDVKREETAWNLDASLEELGRLTETAGGQVVGTVSQHLDKRGPYYLGKGKLDEVRASSLDLEFTTAIFDDELTPAQQRKLESALEVKVIDRTALILDIFARHARTKEGRLQVELAQHEYLLPRLAGQWSHLERLGGGIGTRGPGESQLETDRRLVRNSIHRLQKELEAVRRHRALYRANRQRQGIPVVSLVGYTNAGKSTLMNALTHAGVTAQDQLFATLDPVTRKLQLPDGLDILLTDTVGFIQKLPTALVAAFHATLEELQETDVLVHIVDASHPNAQEQFDTVEDVLESLNVQQKPTVVVLNKADLVAKDPEGASETSRFDATSALSPDSILVSATKGWGLDELRTRLRKVVAKSVLIPEQ